MLITFIIKEKSIIFAVILKYKIQVQDILIQDIHIQKSIFTSNSLLNLFGKNLFIAYNNNNGICKLM